MQYVICDKLFKRYVFKFARDRIPYFYSNLENLIKCCKRDIEKCGKKYLLRSDVRVE